MTPPLTMGDLGPQPDDERKPTRIERIMERYHCTEHDAQRFIDLRDEGYSMYAAAVMAGLRDPDYYDADIVAPDEHKTLDEAMRNMTRVDKEK